MFVENEDQTMLKIIALHEDSISNITPCKIIEIQCIEYLNKLDIQRINFYAHNEESKNL